MRAAAQFQARARPAAARDQDHDSKLCVSSAQPPCIVERTMHAFALTIEWYGDITTMGGLPKTPGCPCE